VVARLRVCHGPAVLGGRGALAAVRAVKAWPPSARGAARTTGPWPPPTRRWPRQAPNASSCSGRRRARRSRSRPPPRWTRGLRGSSRCPLLPRTQEQIETFVDRVLSTW